MAEWAHLRAWVATHRLLLDVAAIGAAAGLTRQQARTLLTPPPDPATATRTAATTERLDAVVRVLSTPPFSYRRHG